MTLKIGNKIGDIGIKFLGKFLIKSINLNNLDLNLYFFEQFMFLYFKIKLGILE